MLLLYCFAWQGVKASKTQRTVRTVVVTMMEHHHGRRVAVMMIALTVNSVVVVDLFFEFEIWKQTSFHFSNRQTARSRCASLGQQQVSFRSKFQIEPPISVFKSAVVELVELFAHSVMNRGKGRSKRNKGL